MHKAAQHINNSTQQVNTAGGMFYLSKLPGNKSQYVSLSGPFTLSAALCRNIVWHIFISDFGRSDQGVTFTLKVTIERCLGDK